MASLGDLACTRVLCAALHELEARQVVGDLDVAEDPPMMPVVMN